MVYIIVNIPGNEEVKSAVSVIISKGGTCRPVPQLDASLLCYVSKGSVVVVVIEPVLAKVGDVDIRPAVIVVVSNGNAVSPTIVRDSGLGRDIRKCPIVVIVKQGCVRWLRSTLQCIVGRPV